MSIASFTSASLEQASQGSNIVALGLACSAVDGTTAKVVTQQTQGNADRIKKFLNENMHIITHFGFPGLSAGSIRIKCINVSNLKTDENDYVSISDIIYHIVRCSIVHECRVDDRIEFTEDTYIGDFDTTFKLPIRIIHGLLAAVVRAPINSDEEFDPQLLQLFKPTQ